MEDKLTPKEEKFIQGLLKGLSQRQAYKEAYNAENMLDETIDSEASRLFKKHKISARYNEMIDKAYEESIMSANERMKWLTEIIKGIYTETQYFTNGDYTEKEVDISNKLKSMEILNKMTGEYITKIEGNVKVDKLEDLL